MAYQVSHSFQFPQHKLKNIKNNKNKIKIKFPQHFDDLGSIWNIKVFPNPV